MRALPATAFTDVVWKHPKVERNWHVTCDYQYYSVPFQLVGKRLTARLTPQVVSLFDNGELVAEHTRLHGFKYRYSTDPAHSPVGNDHGHNVLTRDELVAWASSFGSATVKVITMILDRHRAAIPKGLFQARNVLASLGRKHDKATLEPACREALDRKLIPTFTVLKRLQPNIAHEQRQHDSHSPAGAHQQPSTTPPLVDITQLNDGDVFLRPIEHYTDKDNATDEL